MFKGSIVALVTPFADGAVDEAALARLVEWHVDQGTHGVVPCGTTGESPTLSHAEHRRVIEIVIEAADGKIPVMAGAGSNATQEALDFVAHAGQAGADAALIVTPYYNKPTQTGLLAHYKALNDAAELPLYIYNIPGRSVVDMSIETLAALSELENIVGVKDATGDLNRVSLQRAACGEAFIQLSGEDGTALGFNAHGGVGCISVTANIAPKLCADFQEATLRGDYAQALEIQDRLMPLHQNLFIEASPAPVKFVAAELGLCQSDVRLPLCGISNDSKAVLRDAIQHAGL
ncbi:MAG: 4-hydroxy-tetrahydrodipicolinate synthase [Parvibaculales bacterium]